MTPGFRNYLCYCVSVHVCVAFVNLVVHLCYRDVRLIMCSLDHVCVRAYSRRHVCVHAPVNVRVSACMHSCAYVHVCLCACFVCEKPDPSPGCR